MLDLARRAQPPTSRTVVPKSRLDFLTTEYTFERLGLTEGTFGSTTFCSLPIMKRLRIPGSQSLVLLLSVLNGCVPTAEPVAMDHHLTVKILGAGSVAGSVKSTPSGIHCVLPPNSGGANQVECSASFSAYSVTLSFLPGGAGQTAQFFLLDSKGTRNCLDQPASAGTACTVSLLEDTVVNVYPISIPPPGS